MQKQMLSRLIIAATLGTTTFACSDIDAPLQSGVMAPAARRNILPSTTALVIPTFGGTIDSAHGLSETGQVVGYSYLPANTVRHAYLWQQGQAAATDLGTLGGPSSWASGINASGQIVGTSDRNPATTNGFNHAFLWQNGVMTDLGTLGGPYSNATAINASGQVVGGASTPTSLFGHAALWENGTVRDLGTLTGTTSHAHAINASGQVVGRSATQGNEGIHAFLWQNGSIQELGTLGGSYGEAFDINDSGQIVGASTIAGDLQTHATRWQVGNSPTDLGTLGGLFSRATSINSLGQIVGVSSTAGEAAIHIFLWTPSDGMEDLGISGLRDVVKVNDRLQIIGRLSTGQSAIYQVNFRPNRPPVAVSYSVQTPRNTAVAIALQGSDPDGDTPLAYRVTSGPIHGTLTGTAPSLTYTPATGYAGLDQLTYTVQDPKKLTSGEATVIITVVDPNVAPIVTDITLPGGPVSVGTTVNVSATFTDANLGDTHTATIGWGDGSSSSATVAEPAAGAPGTLTGGHAYPGAGVYTVSVTVIDQGLLSGTLSSAEKVTSAYVVVYDPSAGFVTGGGWIDSPAGAYVADPTATGRASFGFVSRYQKGASIPTGNTQFDFTAGQLRFSSTSYDWLVISGARAQYKGLGTMGGLGSYGFLLTAVDGRIAGGGGTDRFRIKIWDRTNGRIVYDNQLGAADDATPSTALGGGSIVIHS